MSEYIHQDDAYEWLQDKQIQFAEDDFAKVQAERDALKLEVAKLLMHFEYLKAEITRLESEHARGL